ncbi:MAG: CTP-dependent riboflavin kinase [Methanosphaera sp.]|nr:CTP-dependent riboflavin kinase [Methanosphaera sp.]
MLKFEGVVTSGLQKAGNFMKKPTYRKQYLEKLGFIPFYGTLNIKLDDDFEINLKEEFNEELKIIHGNNTLGDVYFLNAEILTYDQNIKKKGAILFPIKTVHKIDTIEFIASEKLRESMMLEDNTKVIIQLNKNQKTTKNI